MQEPHRTPLPWSRSCFVCGEQNRLGLQARSFLVDGEIELAFTPRVEYAGWNAVTHGGLIATVLDEVMTWAAIVESDQACFAADFTVRLRRPLPPGTPVVARARAGEHRRSVVQTEASLESADGTVYSIASGRYMAIPTGQIQEMHHDLVTTPECWPAEHIFGPGNGSGPAAQPGPPAGA
jgi:acyl-coenzyme A thioesterase PaaI-like protein